LKISIRGNQGSSPRKVAVRRRNKNTYIITTGRVRSRRYIYDEEPTNSHMRPRYASESSISRNNHQSDVEAYCSTAGRIARVATHRCTPEDRRDIGLITMLLRLENTLCVGRLTLSHCFDINMP